MRGPERRLGATLVLVAGLALPAPAVRAEPAGRLPDVASVGSAARDLWDLVQQLRGRDSIAHLVVPPQAVPAGGPVIAISDLSRPDSIGALLAALAGVPPTRLRVTVPGGQARLGGFSIGSDQTVTGPVLVLHGTTDVFGRLQGNLVSWDGDVVVHPGGVVSGDVLAVNGRVRATGGEITGEARTLTLNPPAPAPEHPRSGLALTLIRVAGVVGVLISLAALGFGLVAFAPHPLQIVSDTVTHSFGRSFLTGLVGEILMLPTLGMLIVGLVLSVVGVLLLPFAVIVYLLLAITGVVGGFLAVTHALGETWVRRRQAQGLRLATPGSYRFLLSGLIAVAAFWGAWALFGWVPIAGDIVRGVALLVTWILATAGLGAAMLSRAGAKEGFAGRIIPPEALTDEYLWATPKFGVPAVRRPGSPARAPDGSR